MSLGGCGRSVTTGGGGNLAFDRVEVRLVTGAGLRGISMDLAHLSSFVVTEVTPSGPLVGGTCETNAEITNLRAGCALDHDFNAPASAWFVTFQHPPDVTISQGIISVTCQGADALGREVAATCDVGS